MGYIESMKFRIIDLSDCSQKDCSLQQLSVSLSPSCVILRVKEDGFESIGLITHHTLAFFAVEFADYALQNYAVGNLYDAKECIYIARKWLEVQSSVSVEELFVASGNASYNGMHRVNGHINYAAGSAGNVAGYAAKYHNRLYDSRMNNLQTAYANNTAAYAVDAANAAGTSRLDARNRQGTFILNFFGAE